VGNLLQKLIGQSSPQLGSNEEVYLKRKLCWSLLAMLAVFVCWSGSLAQDQGTHPKVKIILAGDSTVTLNAGWGAGFIACMGNGADVTDMAKGGRSSKSYIAEGSWKEVLDAKPDYVLIQFGHNDQKSDPSRGTDPQTTYRQYMNQYLDTAIAAGIKPILVTSISRRQWGKDDKIHSTLQPWADVVKDIAEKRHIPLIDLHAKSIELYEKLGRKEMETMSPTKPSTQPSDDPAEKGVTKLDGTHLNAKGGAYFGRVVAEELAKAVPDLAPYVVIKK